MKPQSQSALAHTHAVREQLAYQGRNYFLIYHFHHVPSSAQATESSEPQVSSIPKRMHSLAATYNMMDSSSDFPYSAHHLQRWFGLNDFVVLGPGADAACEDSEVSQLLSTLSIVLQHCKSPVAVFVPVGDRWKGVYVGYAKEDGVEIRLRSDLYDFIPRSLRHAQLEGLLDLYLNRLGVVNYVSADSSHLSSISDLNISVRYTFMRAKWSGKKWRQDVKLMDAPLNERNESRKTGYFEPGLMWGTHEDPIQALHLAQTWRGIPVNPRRQALIDFPWGAPPYLSIRSLYKDKTMCYLTEALRTLLTAYRQSKFFTHMDQLKISSAGTATLEAMGTLTRSLATTIRPAHFPSAEEIDALIRDIFSENRKWNEHQTIDEPEKKIKAAPAGSLLSSLAAALLNLDGIHAIGLVWTEFVTEVKWHWENGVCLPRTTFPPISYNTALMYQKLQLLNYCISQQNAANKQDTYPNKTVLSKANKLEAASSLQYDGQDDLEEVEDGWSGSDLDELESEMKDKQALDISSESRQGDTKLVDGARLLANKMPLCVPETQDVGYMTEDVLQQTEELFADLGSTSEGAKIRAIIQSASLFSDMQAFKAANPGCVMEDFVRWHSPSDWVQEPKAIFKEKQKATDEKEKETEAPKNNQELPIRPWDMGDGTIGYLSYRMRVADSLWIRKWNEAEPIPASKQPALFNYQKEGQAVIDYLVSITPSKLMEQMTRVSLSCIYHSLECLDCMRIPIVQVQLRTLFKVFTDSSLSGITEEEAEVMCSAVGQFEVLASRASSLLIKLPGEYELVGELLGERGELPLQSTQQQETAQLVFSGEPVDAQEYIFRSWAKRPVATARKATPQRMYALLTNHEFRLSTACTSC
eukprot:TRINITY_DN2558_c0_g1_i3.p1 TRINITY_DN2558_c0_g1~~TRINITY_DN2558_c0_g1_i3.p1  ORF type:complete len:868 (+),score=111.28 TRINITY_DN2558_c0_g1_i3:310-2913(+)